MKLHIPNKVRIFLVDTIVGQMHTNILDVFTSSVIFNSGKPYKIIVMILFRKMAYRKP